MWCSSSSCACSCGLAAFNLASSCDLAAVVSCRFRSSWRCCIERSFCNCRSSLPCAISFSRLCRRAKTSCSVALVTCEVLLRASSIWVARKFEDDAFAEPSALLPWPRRRAAMRWSCSSIRWRRSWSFSSVEFKSVMADCSFDSSRILSCVPYCSFFVSSLCCWPCLCTCCSRRFRPAASSCSRFLVTCISTSNCPASTTPCFSCASSSCCLAVWDPEAPPASPSSEGSVASRLRQ
mmetsp:Transcript_2721/g.7017  ORF Transcript_2721/g.7017 Transcript_2721/m.7017 type:complete len:236 (-) Transcript_2721:275-982(-)